MLEGLSVIVGWAQLEQCVLTLQELLASVFLEERIVGHGSMKVIDHQPEDGVDFLFRVPSIMSQGGVLPCVSVRSR